ncbi:MAG: UDP-N-acetylmuramoyl-L-alanyl-D-glutamate--2,6-diaminopimelate ligase [Candidatus Pacebacteria bacterium]|nr:UDP-N-acetylmuramoyl-L-alanyl-D-glutamate--2,6-diaminopimelate ligase [Candidatus Paceibacterota bacterium]
MKLLSQLLANVDVLEISGNTSVEVESINFFSNIKAPNSLFVSAKNIEHDGFDSISEAIQNGAKVVVYEDDAVRSLLDGLGNDVGNQSNAAITFVKVKNGSKALGIIANNFFDNPSEAFKLIGVTGTNGKTTIATSLYFVFKSLGHKVALISTVENKINDEVFKTTHTTPTPVNLASVLAKAKDAGVEYVFIECSSHGIEEERIAGLRFAGGIFTNFTQDHLNFHGTMENYARSKKKFFDNLSAGAFALSNADDSKGEYMLQNTKAKKYFYGIEHKAHFVASEIHSSFQGTDFKIGDKAVHSKLIGKFNVHNLLAIYGASHLLGVSANEIINIIQDIQPPSGRLEIFKSKTGVFGIVDFAHSPDALEKVITTLSEIKNTNNRIITVVGCGGGGDKTKRPQMGEIVTRLSDYAVFTSDNPRKEDPEEIIKQIVVGIPVDNEAGTHETLPDIANPSKKYECVTDRKEAIVKAVSLAKAGDIVLVAGKGHENYQVFADKTIDYSDQEEVKKALGL